MPNSLPSGHHQQRPEAPRRLSYREGAISRRLIGGEASGRSTFCSKRRSRGGAHGSVHPSNRGAAAHEQELQPGVQTPTSSVQLASSRSQLQRISAWM